MMALTLTIAAVPASAFVGGIKFGNYPQTKVPATRQLESAASAATWKSYGYMDHYNDSADGKMFPSDYMKYADFVVAGEKYRAVRFTKYRSYSTCLHPFPDLQGYVSHSAHSNQDENGYELNKTYFFKYEPLSWRILDQSTGLVMCENVIDAQAFQNMIWNDDPGALQSEKATRPLFFPQGEGESGGFFAAGSAFLRAVQSRPRLPFNAVISIQLKLIIFHHISP